MRTAHARCALRLNAKLDRHHEHDVFRTVWALGADIPQYPEAAFNMAGSINLFTFALEMLSASRQQHKREGSKSNDKTSDPENVALLPRATPLLAGS